MPSHIDFATRLAHAAGASNVTWFADDFADAAEREIGPFDYIVAHGVYSWIGPEVVEAFHRFVDRHLAPGGLLYVSYNAMPGWASDLPLQHILRSLATYQSGPSQHRVVAAGRIVRTLVEAGAIGLVSSPAACAWGTGSHKPAYLAHEYLAPAWRALYVDEVCGAMASIGLKLVGNASLAENFDALVLRRRERESLIPFSDAGNLRELVRDVLLNTRFRYDVYAKGSARLDADQVRNRVLDGHYALLGPANLVKYSFDGPAGRVTFDNPVARAIVAELARGPASLSACLESGLTAQDLVANVLSLCAGGIVSPSVMPLGDPGQLNVALQDQGAFDPGTRLVGLACGTALWFGERLPSAEDDLPSQDHAHWLDFLQASGCGPVVIPSRGHR